MRLQHEIDAESSALADLRVEQLLTENQRLRAALRYQDDRDGRMGTHSVECWSFGHSHYECALAKIAILSASVVPIRAAAEQARAALDDFRCGRLGYLDTWAAALRALDEALGPNVALSGLPHRSNDER